MPCGISGCRVKACLESEIAEYDSYLRGCVYFVSAVRMSTCNGCGHVHEDVLDSVGGVYAEKIDEQFLLGLDVIPSEWRSLIEAFAQQI